MTKPTKFTSEVSKPNLDIGLGISIGEIENAQFINKFGYNSQVNNTAFETVWDGNNNYTYIETAGVAQAASDAAASADDGGTVLVQGLDVNFQQVEETLTIGGAAGTQEFYRIHRANMVTANTGQENVGDVTITCDSKSAAIITADIGQTLMSVYTVPRGYKAYIMQLDCGSSKDLEHHIRLVTKTNGGVWNTKAYFTQRGGFTDLDFKIPLVIDAETDIEVKAKASATSAVSAAFEIILIDHT